MKLCSSYINSLSLKIVNVPESFPLDSNNAIRAPLSSGLIHTIMPSVE